MPRPGATDRWERSAGARTRDWWGAPPSNTAPQGVVAAGHYGARRNPSRLPDSAKRHQAASRWLRRRTCRKPDSRLLHLTDTGRVEEGVYDGCQTADWDQRRLSFRAKGLSRVLFSSCRLLQLADQGRRGPHDDSAAGRRGRRAAHLGPVGRNALHRRRRPGLPQRRVHAPSVDAVVGSAPRELRPPADADWSPSGGCR